MVFNCVYTAIPEDTFPESEQKEQNPDTRISRESSDLVLSVELGTLCTTVIIIVQKPINEFSQPFSLGNSDVIEDALQLYCTRAFQDCRLIGTSRAV